MKVLVMYFTRSGNTEQLAHVLAAALEADCEAIREREGARRAGVLGYLRSLRDAVKHRAARVLPTKHKVGSYDLVAIGTPVWAGRPSTPVEAWLRLNKTHLKAVAFFCSLGGRGSESAFRAMQRLCAQAPVATCAVTGRDVYRDDDRDLMEAFARQIRSAAMPAEAERPVA